MRVGEKQNRVSRFSKRFEGKMRQITKQTGLIGALFGDSILI